MPLRVVVVGGGVTGLTVAYRLLSADPLIDVSLLESDRRPGGKLRSVAVADLVVPAGADSFVARKPWAVDLCRELGLELEPPGGTGAYLWTDRGLVPCLRDAPFGIPGDVGDVLRWPGLSRRGRRRALQDLVRSARRSDEDETLGALLRRRLGDEATDFAVAPLLAGLHAGDVDRLSVRATFPELATWEESQGSLVRGAQAAQRYARRADAGPMFVRPRGGVDALTDGLASRLGSRVRTRARAAWIRQEGSGWVVGLDGGLEHAADVVVVTTPPAEAQRLLGPVAPAAAAELGEIPTASTGVVILVYPEGTRDAIPGGTGFVVPRGKAPMTACTWLSNKWPSEAFGSRAVLRCYMGGVGEERVLEADDPDLVDACARHLAAALALPDRAEDAAVVRWPASMPQYELGHLDRVRRIRRALPDGIVVAGQAFDGVGIADCVRSAKEAAEGVVATSTPARGAPSPSRGAAR